MGVCTLELPRMREMVVDVSAMTRLCYRVIRSGTLAILCRTALTGKSSDVRMFTRGDRGNSKWSNEQRLLFCGRPSSLCSAPRKCVCRGEATGLIWKRAVLSDVNDAFSAPHRVAALQIGGKPSTTDAFEFAYLERAFGLCERLSSLCSAPRKPANCRVLAVICSVWK